jgi:UDPglucose 6-dehydrogenase
VVTAATIKVASNVFLATKIAFANELSRLAAATGADISAVVDGMGLDSRIGRRFLSPGPGFGGSCLPSQARALPEVAASLGVRTPLMEAVARANDEQTAWVVRMVEDALGRPVADASIALLGLTFKAHTDDVRESPSLGVAAQLSSDGATLAVYDPTGSERALRSLAAQRVAARAATNAVDACRGADVVVVLTEWPEFRELDWEAVCAVMRGAAAVDTRDVVDIDRAAAAGVEVIKLGRHAAHGVPRTGDGARQPGEDRRSSEAEPAYADAGAR